MGHPRAARYSVYVTLFQSLVIGILCMIVVLATRNHISTIFTDSEDMRRAVARLSGLLGITMLLNSVQPVISGTQFYLYISSEIRITNARGTEKLMDRTILCVYACRRCYRRWMASTRSLHKLGLLLCFWSAFRVSSRLCG